MTARRILIELVLFSAAFAAVVFLVLVPPPVGIADNGDFPKMIAGFALVPEAASANDAPAYISLRYIKDPKALWVSDNYSIEIPLIRMALWISGLMDSGYFDIRIIGAIHGSIFLASYAALLMALRPLNVKAMTLIAILSFFILGDVCYLSYCNTFYSDASALAFIFPTFVCGLGIAMNRIRPVWLLFAYTVCGCLFIFSKGQHALPAVLLVVFLLVAGREQRMISILLSLLLLASSYVSLALGPPQERAQYLFTLIFFKLAPDTQTAPAIIAELGLRPEYAKYAGMYSYGPNTPMDDRIWAEEFGRQVSQMRIASYYLRHPAVVLRLLQFDLRYWAKEMRSVSFGNYPRSAGKPPKSLTSAFGWWSAIRSSLFKYFEYHLPLWYLIVFVLGAWLLISRQSMLAGLWLVAAGMGAMEFVITSLADAGETARHLLMFHYLTDMTVVLFALVIERQWREWRPQGDSNPCYRRERAVS